MMTDTSGTADRHVLAGGAPGELRVASANLEFGGLDRETGDQSRWQRTIDALAAWAPHIVLVQEMMGIQPYAVFRHAWATANALGMIPLLGPPGIHSASGCRTAILVRLDDGIQITDQGPPPPLLAACPAWCDAALRVPGLDQPLRVYSVHLSARSAVNQREQAEHLASLIAHWGGPAIAGGDWNSYSADDPPPPRELRGQPPHLRSTRMITAPDGTITASHAVHSTLTAAGLTDAAVVLDPARRTPPELSPTGISGAGRVDRLYVTSHLAGHLTRYQQLRTGGSDHDALLLTVSIAGTKTGHSSEGTR
jgi:hypothetical protein